MKRAPAMTGKNEEVLWTMQKITEVTRRNVMDALISQKVVWSGRLSESKFLGRLFDLKQIPSNDRRHEDIMGDIWQHRVNNLDWDDYWLFTDSRFDLLHCDDQVFLRLLCEMLHPVVRGDADEVEHLHQMFNRYLKADGFEIVEVTQISGRPVFAARYIGILAAPGLDEAKATLGKLDPGHVMQQITRMTAAIPSDSELAIGTAKELVETCCKTILNERGVKHSAADNLPRLVRSVAKSLSIAPDDIPDGAKASEIIRRLLMNLATISNGLAELRGSYGTGHGHGAGKKSLGSRHAKLAVGAASTLAVFLMETHQEQSGTNKRAS